MSVARSATGRWLASDSTLIGWAGLAVLAGLAGSDSTLVSQASDSRPLIRTPQVPPAAGMQECRTTSDGAKCGRREWAVEAAQDRAIAPSRVGRRLRPSVWLRPALPSSRSCVIPGGVRQEHRLAGPAGFADAELGADHIGRDFGHGPQRRGLASRDRDETLGRSGIR